MIDIELTTGGPSGPIRGWVLFNGTPLANVSVGLGLARFPYIIGAFESSPSFTVDLGGATK